MPTRNRIPRAGALALACLSAASVAAAATPEPAEGPVLQATERVDRLVPVESAGGRPAGQVSTAALPGHGTRLEPADLPPSIERVTAAALRRQDRTPHFPVAGQFNWGQGGARFGAGRGGRAHEGQDVFGRTGAPLLAVSDSVVLEAGEDGGRGNYIGLYDPVARRTYVYLHLQSPARPAPGRRVSGGEHIGELGCTGSCFGDHLHFEVRRGRGLSGAAEDPLPYLLRWSRLSRSRPTLPPGAH